MKKNSLVFYLLLIVLLITGCNSQNLIEVSNLDDLKNRNVGIYTGSEYDNTLKEKLEDSIPKYYNSYSDLISALKSGKIDAFLTDEPLAKEMIKNNDGIRYLDEFLTEDSYAFAINPNEIELQEEINKELILMKKNGKLDELVEKWFGDDESKKTLSKYDDSKSSKTIKFATVSGSAPFAYMKDNQIVGYDIEIMMYISNQLGYKLEVIEMAWEGIIPAIASGKVDMAGCSIIVTEERKKSVLFSEPDFTGGIVVVVRK
ncbi:MAG: transporter substrate-binding domain-containing protein [Bacilli bacterium]|jgi:ABC-type amino acid transport substrate-binding protein|nr:transporter substrate-binding domain-containing protein [Bacilli bacterium]